MHFHLWTELSLQPDSSLYRHQNRFPHHSRLSPFGLKREVHVNEKSNDQTFNELLRESGAETKHSWIGGLDSFLISAGRFNWLDLSETLLWLLSFPLGWFFSSSIKNIISQLSFVSSVTAQLLWFDFFSNFFFGAYRTSPLSNFSFCSSWRRTTLATDGQFLQQTDELIC